MFFLGEAFALGVSVCDATCCSLLNSIDKRISTFTINFVKLIAAALFVFLLRIISAGVSIPAIPLNAWIFLCLSGVIGYLLGDMLFIGSFRYIPYRLSMVIYYTNPVFTTLLAALLFHQRVSLLQLLGIALTIGGTSMALLLDHQNQSSSISYRWKSGLFLAFFAMLAQSANVLLSMRASDLLGEMPGKTLLCSQIRQFSGLFAFSVYAFVQNLWPEFFQQLRYRNTLGRIMLGGIAGNGVGPVLLLQSIQYIPVGISTALASLSPLLVIPISAIFFNDRVRLSGIIGACITVIGVILLA